MWLLARDDDARKRSQIWSYSVLGVGILGTAFSFFVLTNARLCSTGNCEGMGNVNGSEAATVCSQNVYKYFNMRRKLDCYATSRIEQDKKEGFLESWKLKLSCFAKEDVPISRIVIDDAGITMGKHIHDLPVLRKTCRYQVDCDAWINENGYWDFSINTVYYEPKLTKRSRKNRQSLREFDLMCTDGQITYGPGVF